jgi:hypothetical protein
MQLLVNTAEATEVGLVLLDPFLEVADRVAADAELDEMHGHDALVDYHALSREPAATHVRAT